MSLRCIQLTKVWEDTDFFELKMVAHSPQCIVNIDFYTTNEELEQLRTGIASLGTVDEFEWISGSDSENVTHYINIRFFIYGKRGHVAICFNIDNKLESPFTTKANFHIITELGSLDDFSAQLKRLIQDEEQSIAGIEYSMP